MQSRLPVDPASQSMTEVASSVTSPAQRVMGQGVARVRGEGCMLRSLAGAAAGHRALSRDRAGSFLVLVVGTLALLAVITIVYVALGNQDARTKAAVTKREQLDDVPRKMADYVAGVITRDTWALTNTGEQRPDPAAPGTLIPTFRRETSDIPGVQWSAFTPLTTAQLPAAGEFRFGPIGGLEPNANGVIVVPPVEIAGTDPWLAPHRPVDLNWNNTSPINQPDFRKNLDWMSITNIAPDGAFVNLFNLRTFGLAATTSQLRGDGAGAVSPSLLDVNGQVTTATDFGIPADPNRTAHYTMRQFRAYRPAQPAGTQDPLFGEDPSDQDYKLYQWVDADGDGMLDSRIFELADLANSGQQLPTFAGKYRYFFGARIVDLSGLINVNFAGDQVAPPSALVGPVGTGTTPTTQVPLGLTPADIDLRRILTMVDVYANTDINATGDQDGAGIGYDEIHNSFVIGDPANYAFESALQPGYDETQAYFTGTAAYLSLRLALASGEVPPLTDFNSSADYTFPSGATAPGSLEYTATFNPPATFTQTMTDYVERKQINLDTAVPSVWPESPSRWKFSEWPINIAAPAATNAEVFSLPAARARFYNDQAIRLFQSSTDFAPSSTIATTFSGRFGLGDLAELLTRRGTNDPTVTSALERALGARDSTPGGDALRYDPLRSNRDEDVERRRYDTVDTSVANVENRDRTLLQLDGDVRSLLTPVSWSRQVRSTPLVANGTAFTPISPFELRDGERKIDVRALLDLEVRDAAGNPIASDTARASAGLFVGYADALAPYSYLPESWQPDGAASGVPLFQQYRTLFYGYAGADVAVMSAAHMAVNMADMGDGDARYDTSTATPIFTGGYDDNSEPTARTLLLSGVTGGTSLRALLNGALVTAAIRQTSFPSWVPEIPVGQPTQNLALPNFKLAQTASGAGSPVVPAIEVYGIEPQPFIAQVATYTVYADLDDGNNVPPPLGGPVQAVIGTNVDAVASSATLGTREVLYRMVAFKLVNPFDKDVVLSKDPYSDVDPTLPAGTPLDPTYDATSIDVRAFPGQLDTAKNFHYIRFGDRSFMMLQLDQEVVTTGIGIGNYIATPSPEFPSTTLKGITIPANSTAIVYALSEPPSQILETIRDVDTTATVASSSVDFGAGPVAGGNLKETIQRTLLRTMGYEGPTAPGGIRIFWVPMIAGTTTGVAESLGTLGDATSAFIDPTGGTLGNVQNLANFVDVIPTAASLAPGANATASLWRAIRQQGTGAAEQVTSPVPAGVTAPNSVAYAPNDYTNDMLVDRFRLPGVITQIRNQVTASPGPGDEITVALSDTATNVAVSITAVYRASRPLDIGTSGAAPPRGVLPGYCFEAKYYGLTPADSWNLRQAQYPPTPSDLVLPWDDIDDITDYDSPDFGDPSTTPYTGLFNGVGGWTAWIAAASKSNFGPSGVGAIVDYTLDDTLESDPRVSSSASITDSDCLDNPVERANALLVVPNLNPLQATVGGFTLDQMYPQISLATPRFRSGDLDATVVAGTPATVQSISILRLADTLLPMGVGPQRAPLNPDGSPRLNGSEVLSATYGTQMNWQYTSLGEALAISMGYENLDFPSIDLDAWTNDPALRFGPYRYDGSTVTLTLPAAEVLGEDPSRVLLFDRGQLALDRFVPFVDYNNTGATNALVFNPPATYGSLAATDDQRWGLQIPAAQAVLDQFTVPVAGREPGQELLRETLTRGTPGLININTAPIEVLRTLPLMSSRPFQWSNGGTPDWRSPYQFAPDPSEGPTYPADRAAWKVDTGAANWLRTLNQAWDIPAGIAAFRDQRPVIAAPSVRTFAVERMTVSPAPDGLAAALSYPVPNTIDAATFEINSADPSLGGPGVIGREAATSIPGLGDELGFSSIGALLSVRNPLAADANIPTVGASNRLVRRFAPSRAMSLSVDAMGADDPVGSTSGGINNTDPRIDPYAGSDNGTAGAGTTTNPYRPVNEYREKLQLANGSLNLITNRSDLFAAYFVVLGVSEEDLQAVAEGAASIPARQVPLIPSVQRRFLMVVDRSTVVKQGDQPKVLLFKEVPM
jgi:hypothetical protein